MNGGRPRAFRIEYTADAVKHLAGLTARQSATVLDQVERKLKHQPTQASRNRKLLRANAIAPWDLRLGELRVYFDVSEDPRPTVTVRAIGIKVRDRVLIAGREADLA
jgi:mRNA-degrading endonuclease RelE of RelBE toxin-antitoxin system